MSYCFTAVVHTRYQVSIKLQPRRTTSIVRVTAVLVTTHVYPLVLRTTLRTNKCIININSTNVPCSLHRQNVGGMDPHRFCSYISWRCFLASYHVNSNDGTYEYDMYRVPGTWLFSYEYCCKDTSAVEHVPA